MPVKQKFDADKIEYIKVREIAFSYAVPEDTTASEKNTEPFQFDLEIVKMVNQSESAVRLILTINLKRELGKKREATGIYTTEHIFSVENFNNLIVEKKGQFEMDEALDHTLTGLAYSTVRGLCFQKFYGTALSGFILPIKTPDSLTE